MSRIQGAASCCREPTRQIAFYLQTGIGIFNISKDGAYHPHPLPLKLCPILCPLAVCMRLVRSEGKEWKPA